MQRTFKIFVVLIILIFPASLSAQKIFQLFEYINRKTQRKVAVKRMANIFDDQVDAKRAYREMHILRY